jgi:YfiH family protein
MDIHWKNEKNENTRLHRSGSAVWLSFAPLDREAWLLDAFSTRLGGVSRGFLGEMNLSFDRGDSELNVKENFRRFSAAAGFAPEDIVSSAQTHTTNVIRVGESDRGRGITKVGGWQDVDGMVTDAPGVVLYTTYADCVPLYFADPAHKAIGLSHSGWKGTAHKMGQVTVKKMQEEFGTDPQELICVIGPSICRDCYEVGEDVARFFDRDCLISGKNGKYQLDLWKANRKVLLEAGVREERIMMPDLCTCCNPDFLFSHRASHGKRGNLGAFLGIRQSSCLDKE